MTPSTNAAFKLKRRMRVLGGALATSRRRLFPHFFSSFLFVPGLSFPGDFLADQHATRRTHVVTCFASPRRCSCVVKVCGKRFVRFEGRNVHVCTDGSPEKTAALCGPAEIGNFQRDTDLVVGLESGMFTPRVARKDAETRPGNDIPAERRPP